MAADIVGYIASALVLTTFITRDMRRLRIIAILSNVAFAGYGALDSLAPVLCLHMLLLPLNLFRLIELQGVQPGSHPIWRGAFRARLAKA